MRKAKRALTIAFAAIICAIWFALITDEDEDWQGLGLEDDDDDD